MPLGKSGAAVLLEMVMHGGVDGDEFLQTSHAPEVKHGPFSSSKWQVLIFCEVIQPSTGFLALALPVTFIAAL